LKGQRESLLHDLEGRKRALLGDLETLRKEKQRPETDIGINKTLLQNTPTQALTNLKKQRSDLLVLSGPEQLVTPAKLFSENTVRYLFLGMLIDCLCVFFCIERGGAFNFAFQQFPTRTTCQDFREMPNL